MVISMLKTNVKDIIRQMVKDDCLYLDILCGNQLCLRERIPYGEGRIDPFIALVAEKDKSAVEDQLQHIKSDIEQKVSNIRCGKNTISDFCDYITW